MTISPISCSLPNPNSRESLHPKLFKANQHFQANEYEETAKILKGLANNRDVRVSAEAHLVLGFLHYNELGVPKKAANQKIGIRHWTISAGQKENLWARIEALIKLAAAEKNADISRSFLNDCLSSNPSTDQQKRISDLFEELESRQAEENEDFSGFDVSEKVSIKEESSPGVSVNGFSSSHLNGNGLYEICSSSSQEVTSVERDSQGVKIEESNSTETEKKQFASDEAWIKAAYSKENEGNSFVAESLWQGLLQTTTDLHVKLMVRNHLRKVYKIVVQ